MVFFDVQENSQTRPTTTVLGQQLNGLPFRAVKHVMPREEPLLAISPLSVFRLQLLVYIDHFYTCGRPLG